MIDDAVIAAAHALRADRVRGAMELAEQAVVAAVDVLAANDERDVRVVARALATARPSMAAIGNAVALTLAAAVDDRAGRAQLRVQAELLREQWAAD
ncbi:MAG: hypothetical protein M3Y58_10325, partial [Chloroflexota bacterium]|nr:hypothetical protein [Chloroflexota bacterium]